MNVKYICSCILFAVLDVQAQPQAPAKIPTVKILDEACVAPKVRQCVGLAPSDTNEKPAQHCKNKMTGTEVCFTPGSGALTRGGQAFNIDSNVREIGELLAICKDMVRVYEPVGSDCWKEIPTQKSMDAYTNAIQESLKDTLNQIRIFGSGSNSPRPTPTAQPSSN